MLNTLSSFVANSLSLNGQFKSRQQSRKEKNSTFLQLDKTMLACLYSHSYNKDHFS